MRSSLYLGLILLAAAPFWAQTGDTVMTADNGTTDVQNRMLMPPPVSGEAYSVVTSSEDRSNYLHYGLTFGSAYSDNTLGASTGRPVSDVSYSIWPTISLDKTTSRVHWGLTYAPGFTFYQRTSARNESDQNASLSFQYRVSPHVTFIANDTFQRSSNILNQPNLSVGSVSGGVQVANESVIAPLADRLSNFGNVGLTYQYSANDMVGASGTFGNLHYPNPSQVPGLYDSSSQGGTAFYAHRLTPQHYVGSMYQYQRLLSYTGAQDSETQTHGAFLFYAVFPTEHFSMSIFGGAQRSETFFPGEPSLDLVAFSSRQWNPAGGASLSWQGRLTGAALSCLHIVSEGGGLIGAVTLESVNAAIRREFSRNFSGSVSGSYANNNLLGPPVLFNNGHSIEATAALEHRFGEHLGLQVGYTRLHQTYNIALISATPNTNREFVSISYDFARPLGR